MFLAAMIYEVLNFGFFAFLKKIIRKRGRAVEGNSLENCHGETHQEFESLRFLKKDRREIRRARVGCEQVRAFCV